MATIETTLGNREETNLLKVITTSETPDIRYVTTAYYEAGLLRFLPNWITAKLPKYILGDAIRQDVHIFVLKGPAFLGQTGAI